ncbi:unnamed protein product [Penicillium bialowiezense]
MEYMDLPDTRAEGARIAGALVDHLLPDKGYTSTLTDGDLFSKRFNLLRASLVASRLDHSSIQLASQVCGVKGKSDKNVAAITSSWSVGLVLAPPEFVDKNARFARQLENHTGEAEVQDNQQIAPPYTFDEIERRPYGALDRQQRHRQILEDSYNISRTMR